MACASIVFFLEVLEVGYMNLTITPKKVTFLTFFPAVARQTFNIGEIILAFLLLFLFIFLVICVFLLTIVTLVLFDTLRFLHWNSKSNHGRRSTYRRKLRRYKEEYSLEYLDRSILFFKFRQEFKESSVKKFLKLCDIRPLFTKY